MTELPLDPGAICSLYGPRLSGHRPHTNNPDRQFVADGYAVGDATGLRMSANSALDTAVCAVQLAMSIDARLHFSKCRGFSWEGGHIATEMPAIADPMAQVRTRCPGVFADHPVR